MTSPKKVRYEENGRVEYLTHEEAQFREIQKQNKRQGRGLLITAGVSFVAVLCAWASADWAEESSKAADLNAHLSSTVPCNDYRTAVLNLHDHGLGPDQIAAVLNLEQTSVNSQGDAGTPGPAYDKFYKPRCGDAKDVVANLYSSPGGPNNPPVLPSSAPTAGVPSSAPHP